MRLRIGSIAVLLIAIVAFASSAAACEKCVSAGYNNWVKCESGHASGSQSCSGGFGVSCSLTGSCGTSGGGGKNPPVPEPAFSPVEPCLACVEDKPTQGFMLRGESILSSASSERSAFE